MKKKNELDLEICYHYFKESISERHILADEDLPHWGFGNIPRAV